MQTIRWLDRKTLDAAIQETVENRKLIIETWSRHQDNVFFPSNFMRSKLKKSNAIWQIDGKVAMRKQINTLMALLHCVTETRIQALIWDMVFVWDGEPQSSMLIGKVPDDQCSL